MIFSLGGVFMIRCGCGCISICFTQAATFGAREFHAQIVCFPVLDIEIDGVESPLQITNKCHAQTRDQ